MKNLIPFFDGLAIFMPEELVEQVIDSDPYLVQPLYELGYRRNIDRNVTLDEDLSNRILEMVRKFVQDERFSRVDRPNRRTISHFGSNWNRPGVLAFLRDLERLGLAGAIGEDGTFAAQSEVCSAIVENCFFALGQKLQSSASSWFPQDRKLARTLLPGGKGIITITMYQMFCDGTSKKWEWTCGRCH